MAADNYGKGVNLGRLARFLARCDSRFATKDAATSGAAGLMSAADKAKLDGLSGMTATELSAGTSTEPRTVSPKVMSDYVSGEIDGALGVVANGSY